LFRYLDTRVHDSDVLTLYNVALQAARLTADRRAEAHLLNDLAGVHSRHRRNDVALEHLQQALRIDRGRGRSGHRRG
jgi:thioredoxin-like negative regulator of GroEL